jgi:phosphatidylinositol alpha-1,6-mannosyltransferase
MENKVLDIVKENTLILTSGFPSANGGMQRMIEGICKYSQRFAPIVLTRRLPDQKTQDCRCTIVQYPLRTRGGIIKNSIFFLYAVFLAYRYRAKMILCIRLRDGYIALPLIALRRIPVVVFLHGHEVEESLKSHPFWSKLVFKKTSLFLASSNYTRDKAVQLGIARNKIKTLLPGTFLPQHCDTADGDIIKSRHCLKGKKIILTVSRLVSHKGIDTVIRALARASLKRDDIAYLVVGKGPDERRLRSLTKELGVSDKTVFCGFVPDNELPAYYKACDIFAMVSRTETTEGVGCFEGFGISFTEAAAAGKPSIAGMCGGTGEAVIDNKTGLLVNPTSVDEVATALSVLLENPSLTEQLGRHGKERARQMTWPIYVANLENFLQELTKK